MNGILGKLLSNRHTTGAGGAFDLIKAAQHIALLWTPAHYAPAIRGTAEALESAALVYGLVAAGDAGKGKEELEAVKKDVAEMNPGGKTALLYRKDLPVPAEQPKTIT